MDYSDDFWRLFSKTGYIGNYLMYKNLRRDEDDELSDEI